MQSPTVATGGSSEATAGGRDQGGHTPGFAAGRNLGRHARSKGEGLTSLLTWTTLGAMVPGVAFIAAGRKKLGVTLLVMTILLVLSPLALLLVPDRGALVGKVVGKLAQSPELFYALAGAICLGTLTWMILVITGHVALRRNKFFPAQNALAAVLVAALCVGVAAPGVYATQTTLALHDAQSIFGAGGESDGAMPDVKAKDPWEGISRVNTLLVGSDADEDRRGSRADALIVMSTDVRTGNTVLISVPRNLQDVPFKPGTPGAAKWPRGFNCRFPNNPAENCMINSVWEWTQQNKNLFGDKANDPYLPVQVTKEVVEQTLNLKIDNWVMVSIGGFRDLVTAMGGLELNVKERVAVGINGGRVVRWIPAGKQKLDGEDTLWFARSRYHVTDYDRMARQRCVISALTEQVDAKAMALKLPQLVNSAERNIATSIRPQQVEAFVDLAQRIKKGTRTTVGIGGGDGVNTGRPDFVQIQKIVATAIADSTKPPATAVPLPPGATAATPGGPPTAPPTSVKGGKVPPTSESKTPPGTLSNASDVC